LARPYTAFTRVTDFQTPRFAAAAYACAMLHFQESEMTLAQPRATTACALPPARSASKIVDLLSMDDIVLGLDAADKTSAFEALAERLQCQHGLDAIEICRSLAEREKLGSTGLGRGIAIPHARLEGLRQPVAVFARLSMPIAFDAPDNKPVSDMLVLLVPEHANDSHLKILADVAAMFCESDFRSALHAATDAARVRLLFATWQP
jgi:nitrogen PTS system EIIA component